MHDYITFPRSKSSFDKFVFSCDTFGMFYWYNWLHRWFIEIRYFRKISLSDPFLGVRMSASYQITDDATFGQKLFPLFFVFCHKRFTRKRFARSSVWCSKILFCGDHLRLFPQRGLGLSLSNHLCVHVYWFSSCFGTRITPSYICTASLYIALAFCTEF